MPVLHATGLFLGVVLCLASAPGQEPPADQGNDPEVVVPAGTLLPVTLTSFLNTRSSQVGDAFYAETIHPIFVNQRLVIPRGALVRGTVTEVTRPGKVKGKGRLAVRFDSVQLPNGVSRPLIASLRSIHGPGVEKLDRTRESVEMDSSKGEDAGAIASTTAQGAMIGAISDGWTGVGYGAGAGAAAGLVATLFVRGPELVLQPGTGFDLELKQPVRFAGGELDLSSGQPYTPRRYTSSPARFQRDRPPSYRRGYRPFIPWLGPWY
jgi:type IV secretion system protein VirB10